MVASCFILFTWSDSFSVWPHQKKPAEVHLVKMPCWLPSGGVLGGDPGEDPTLEPGSSLDLSRCTSWERAVRTEQWLTVSLAPLSSQFCWTALALSPSPSSVPDELCPQHLPSSHHRNRPWTPRLQKSQSQSWTTNCCSPNLKLLLKVLKRTGFILHVWREQTSTTALLSWANKV